MHKLYSKGYNGWKQLAILLGLVGVFMIAGSLISVVIFTQQTGISLLDANGLSKAMGNPKYVGALQLMQALSTFFIFFLPAVLFAFICYYNGWAYLGFRGKISWKQLLIVCLIVLCWLPLTSALQSLNEAIPLPATWKARFDALESAYEAQVLVIGQMNSWGQYFISVLVIALLPAVFEETLFRGGLQNMLTRWTKLPWLSIVITAILFSAIHFSWYGFLARFALGAALGYIYYRTHSIWLNIIAHFINNALAVSTLFWLSQQGKPIDLKETDNFPLWAGGIGLGLVLGLFKLLAVHSPVLSIHDEIVSDNKNNPFIADDVE